MVAPSEGGRWAQPPLLPRLQWAGRGCRGPRSCQRLLGQSPQAHAPSKQQQTVFYSSVKTGYTIGYSLSLAALVVAMAILTLFR